LEAISVVLVLLHCPLNDYGYIGDFKTKRFQEALAANIFNKILEKQFIGCHQIDSILFIELIAKPARPKDFNQEVV
jgi:hypothetical protein